MTDENEMYVVEYSRRQHWFRVDRLNKVLTTNVQLLYSGIPSDFVILFIGLFREAHKACDMIQKRIGYGQPVTSERGT